MKNNPYSAEERETIINFCDADNSVDVYTASSRVMNKLDKLCEKYPNAYLIVTKDDFSKTYKIVDKKLIRFCTPRKPLTEEERKIVAERLKKYTKK